MRDIQIDGTPAGPNRDRRALQRHGGRVMGTEAGITKGGARRKGMRRYMACGRPNLEPAANLTSSRAAPEFLITV